MGANFISDFRHLSGNNHESSNPFSDLPWSLETHERNCAVASPITSRFTLLRNKMSKRVQAFLCAMDAAIGQGRIDLFQTEGDEFVVVPVVLSTSTSLKSNRRRLRTQNHKQSVFHVFFRGTRRNMRQGSQMLPRHARDVPTAPIHI